MAKQTHQQTQASSSRNAMIALAIGGLLVAGLVGWALTRTVEAPVATTPTAALEQFPSTTAPVATGSDAITDTNAASGYANTATTATAGTSAPLNAPATASAAPQGDRTPVGRISAEDLRARVNRGEVTVVDVRDANSFAAGHIPGAIHVPFASVEAQLDQIPRGKDIVTYCTWPAEESSAGAALIMKNKGINNVSALYGGLDAWRKVGYPTETGAQ